MIRLLALIVALFVPMATASGQEADQPAGSESKRVLTEIVDVQPVRLQRPATFWREGKPEQIRDTVLIRARIGQIGEFLPRGIGPPLFMYGAWVAEMLLDPLGDGVAVVLAPRPQPGESPTLWLAPAGSVPEQFTAEQRKRLFRSTVRRSPGRVISVRPPPADARVTPVQDLPTLRRKLAEDARKPKKER